MFGANATEYKLIHMKSGREFYLPKKTLIGRNKGELILADHTTSSRHAYIEVRDGSVFARDLNSSNGTYVDGVRLRANAEVEVQTGDIVQIGRHCFKLVHQDEIVEEPSISKIYLPKNVTSEKEERTLWNYILG